MQFPSQITQGSQVKDLDDRQKLGEGETEELSDDWMFMFLNMRNVLIWNDGYWISLLSISYRIIKL